MTEPRFLIEGFGDVPFAERLAFNYEPLLNLREAFDQIKSSVPEKGSVTIFQDKGAVAVCIRPDASRDEPLLSYQFSAKHGSVIIRRIHAGATSGKGLGTSLISSQFAFWSRMGAEVISVFCHDNSQGFYEKLGFQRVDALPEYPPHMNQVLTPMRLDLKNPEQKSRFLQAIGKSQPLSSIDFTL